MQKEINQMKKKEEAWEKKVITTWKAPEVSLYMKVRMSFSIQ